MEKIFFSSFNVFTYLFVQFVQLLFSSWSCAGSFWLPLPLVSFPSFSLLFFFPPPNPNRPCQSERSPKARHEADSFEPAEFSERLTPGQSGWLGAAAAGSIPALAFSLSFLRKRERARVLINFESGKGEKKNRSTTGRPSLTRPSHTRKPR